MGGLLGAVTRGKRVPATLMSSFCRHLKAKVNYLERCCLRILLQPHRMLVALAATGRRVKQQTFQEALGADGLTSRLNLARKPQAHRLPKPRSHSGFSLLPILCPLRRPLRPSQPRPCTGSSLGPETIREKLPSIPLWLFLSGVQTSLAGGKSVEPAAWLHVDTEVSPSSRSQSRAECLSSCPGLRPTAFLYMEATGQ